MALFITNGNQDVASGSIVPLTGESRAKCIVHTLGSGQIGLRGITKQCSAKYRVSFTANTTVVGTLAPVSFALIANGEVINGATMTVTPASIGDLFNISATTEITVPQGMTTQLAVMNVGTQTSTVNGTLAVTRIA